jgi:hypothetical protein
LEGRQDRGAGKEDLGKEVPKVFVSTTPAELIVLQGAASYLSVQGAPTLLWVNNTEAISSGWASA